MRTADVYYQDHLAGHLIENEDGYSFTYTQEFLSYARIPISVTLPLQNTSFHSSQLFPFFDGLIPEGWLLDIGAKNWKLDRRDRMGLLLALCKDCLGAVSVIPSIPKETSKGTSKGSSTKDVKRQ